jgi:predicted acyltransferase
MPINKEIWTPSFTVFTAGMALLCLGTVFFFVDVLGKRAWAFPFVIYGMNAIAAFCAASIVYKLGAFFLIQPRGYKDPVPIVAFAKDWCDTLVANLNEAFQHVAPHYTINLPANTSLAYALLFVLTIFVLMSILYVLKIFVKV